MFALVLLATTAVVAQITVKQFAENFCGTGGVYEGSCATIGVAPVPCSSIVTPTCVAFAASSTGANASLGLTDDATYGTAVWRTGAVNATAGLQSSTNSTAVVSAIGDFASFSDANNTAAQPPIGASSIVGFVRGSSAFLYQQLSGAIVQGSDYELSVRFCSSLNAQASTSAKMTVIVTNSTLQGGFTPAGPTPSGFPFRNDFPLVNAKTAQSRLFAAGANATCGTLTVRFTHYELFSQLNMNRTFTVFLFADSAGISESVFYDQFAVKATNRYAAGTCRQVFINELDFNNALDTSGRSLEAIEIAAPVGTDLAAYEVSLINSTGGEYFRTTFPNLNLLLGSNFVVRAPSALPGSPVGFLVLGFPPGIRSGDSATGAPSGVVLYAGATTVQQYLCFDGNRTNTLRINNVDVVCDAVVDRVTGLGVNDTSNVGSVQLTGCGDCYEEFDWKFQTQTFGPSDATNTGQTFCTDTDLDGSWQGRQTQRFNESGIFPGTLVIAACCGGNDCNDRSNTTYPGAPEICDGQDSNCDGVLPVSERDGDRDGRIPCDGDCNDADADTYGSATVIAKNQPVTSTNTGEARQEVCDGKDNDCLCAPLPVSGVVDCVDELWPTVIYFPDTDLDGFGDGNVTTASGIKLPSFANCTFPNGTSPFRGFASNNLDCNDRNASLTLSTPEICDGLDNNCDGRIDEIFNITDNDADGFRSWVAVPGDLHLACASFWGPRDCNDTNRFVKPNSTSPNCRCPATPAVETCDGFDNNCDGRVDEGLWIDADNDGFSSPLTDVSCCGQIPAYVNARCGTDCDDARASVNPAAADVVCDGIDNNCSGLPDLATTLIDADSDKWYVAPRVLTNAERLSCIAGGFSLTDCNDNNARINPGLSETDPRFRLGVLPRGQFGDGLDNNCNGDVDETVRDFVQFEATSQVLALDIGAGGNDERHADRDDKRCVPNYALILSLTNVASRTTATNVIIKGKIVLPHGGVLPTAVLGDLINYGIKIGHNGASSFLTWVQFKLAPSATQNVAIPLCLEAAHTQVHGSFSVVGSDQTDADAVRLTSVF